MALNKKQEALIDYWVNHPLEKNVQIYKAVGISETTFYRWIRNDKEFMEVYKQRCQERFNSLEALAVDKLKEQVEQGQWNAVKYVLDGQGYAAAQKIDLDANVIKVTLTDD